jgi:hypothetical protein
MNRDPAMTGAVKTVISETDSRLTPVHVESRLSITDASIFVAAIKIR